MVNRRFNRPNNRNRRNTRNGVNNRNNRRAKNPSQVSRQNGNTVVRTFRAISRIFFQQDGDAGVGGVQGGFSFASPLSSYTGFEFVSDNFEQYSVSAVEVLMKP